MSTENKFRNEYICETSKDLEYIRNFKINTEKRIQELNEKKQNRTITRAEIFELDMCKGDLVRAKKTLGLV